MTMKFNFCPMCWLLASNEQNVYGICIDCLNGTSCEAKYLKYAYVMLVLLYTYQAVVTVKVKVGLPCPQLLQHLV